MAVTIRPPVHMATQVLGLLGGFPAAKRVNFVLESLDLRLLVFERRRDRVSGERRRRRREGRRGRPTGVPHAPRAVVVRVKIGLPFVIRLGRVGLALLAHVESDLQPLQHVE